MNYLIEVKPLAIGSEGQKPKAIKRLGWAKDEKLIFMPVEGVSIEKDGKELPFVKSACFVKISKSEGNILGYEFTPEDKSCKDWVTE